MEGTYTVEGYPHVSHQINLRQTFCEYSKYLSEKVFSLSKGGNQETLISKIQTSMGIAAGEAQTLENNLNLEQLGSSVEENQPRIATKGKKHTRNPEEQLLEKATRTLATAVEFKAAKARPFKYAKKLKDITTMKLAEFAQEEISTPLSDVPETVVLIARIFKPFYNHTVPQQVPHAQDVMLHGDQTLAKFRDHIACLNDEVVVGDSSRDGADDSQVPMKQLFTSGMFFFGDTFYCDFRDTINKDYGHVISEWAKANPDMKLGPFKHKSMEDTLISDLDIRLGYPYVYVHLGACEHVITFVDARLLSLTDVQDVNMYPLVESADNRLVYCYACDTYSGAWIVEDDKFPTKPTTLCKQCFEVFYTRDGQRLSPSFCCLIPGALNSQINAP